MHYIILVWLDGWKFFCPNICVYGDWQILTLNLKMFLLLFLPDRPQLC